MGLTSTQRYPGILRSAAIVIIFCLSAVKVNGQNIEIHITGIKTLQGQIGFSIFLDQKSFKEQKPFKQLQFKKTSVVNGSMVQKITLPPGTYGFALLDDVNTNRHMDYNFFGLPEEGFGFSNFYLTGFKRPYFDQFKFTVHKDQKVKVVMKIRYL